MKIEELKAIFPGEWKKLFPNEFLLLCNSYFIHWKRKTFVVGYYDDLYLHAESYDSSLEETRIFYNTHFKFKNFK